MEYRASILKEIRVGLKKEDNQKNLFLGLTIIGMILLTLLFLLPTTKRISVLKAENQELENTKKEYTKILSNYEKAANYNKKISPYKEKIYVRVPLEPNSIEAFNELDLISKSSNLSLAKISTKRLLSNQEDFEIIFSGDFSDIENFFNKIRFSKRYFSIQKLNIRHVKSKIPKETKLFMNLTVSSLFLKNE